MSDLEPVKPSQTSSRRWKLLSTLGVLIAVQLLAYQNCGSDFVVKDAASLASLSSSGTCEDALAATFATSYYPFLKQNCAACHTGAGPGQGAFASGDANVAFSAFLLATDNGTDTASKVDANATNTAHAGASYTGPQNTSAIAVAAQQWSSAEAMCKSGGGTTAAILTSSKTMNATAADKDIVFNLGTDLANASGSNLGGATLTIAVHLATSPNGATVYYFSNPRLKGGTVSVSLQGLMVRINGAEQTLGSTWSRVSGTANAAQTVQLSTATMIIEYDGAVAADTLSLSIDSLSPAN